MPEYTYETQWNGLTLEIFSTHSKDTAFFQGDAAADVLDELNDTETDEQEQRILARVYNEYFGNDE